MGTLTDLASARVKAGVTILYGQIISTPAIYTPLHGGATDGFSVVYVCDVQIDPLDPTGAITQAKSFLEGVPESPGFKPGDELTVNRVLHNVMIARNNVDLLYADVGVPVTISRSESGQWEITGLAPEMPGTYTLVPVDLDELVIGSVIDLTLYIHPLTLGELGTFAPFGTLPLGVKALYEGERFVRYA